MPAFAEVERPAQPSTELQLRNAHFRKNRANFRPFGSKLGHRAPVEHPTETSAPLPPVDHRPWLTALVVVAVCVVGAVAIGRSGWNHNDDGASVVPLVALGGIAVGTLRWRPRPNVTPTREVTSTSAAVISTSAAILTIVLTTWPSLAPVLAGPVLSVALLGTYLALWGYRLLALLRALTVMSLLTWQPVAEFCHNAVRSSLEQPSALIYRRLAQIPFFSIDQEPWRLFSAELHRGSLVVIATFVLSIGANRWRVSPGTLLHLALTITVALVAHHVVILASPIDQYAPTDVTQVATNPTLELAISGSAVLLLSFLRSQHRRRAQSPAEQSEPETPTSDAAESERIHRDPVIFAMTNRMAHPAITAMLLSGVAPLAALALAH